MGWTTYVDALRLDRQTWYYIWRVDDDLSVDHPLLGTPSGALLHASEAGALAVAREIAEPIRSKELHTTDLDAALAWATAPEASSLDAGVLMTSWRSLVDLGALPSPVTENTTTESELEEIFDKVHWPDTPIEWTHAEVALLAATLEEGIERLRGLLPAIVAPDSAPPAG